MKRLLCVYADFDWLSAPTLVGELSYEHLRGSEVFGFKFDSEWLKNYPSLTLSDDLQPYAGWQYREMGSDIFGCFSDALPDRWGRTLLLRREQVMATEEGRPVHRLTSFDFLIGIDDFSRMGGFRFKERLTTDFINQTKALRIPPIASLKELLVASKEVEKGEEKHLTPERKWLDQLLMPGTSLGGARPKAGVVDETGALFVAKFPSRKDEYDVGLWEHFAHFLASKAGIKVAYTKVVSLGEQYHTMLSRRFDRTNDGRRIHFASAMTLLGLTDGDNAQTGYGYLDIVDFIIKGCTDIEANLRELYRRVAFNISIGNSDDHFRNHGFLLTPKGWTLSPAYDMNPTLNPYQSLLISSRTSEADLSELLSVYEEYMLSHEVATMIIDEVLAVVKNWEAYARPFQLSQREMTMFGRSFEQRLAKYSI